MGNTIRRLPCWPQVRIRETFNGRNAHTAICKNNKTTETNHERHQHEAIPARTASGWTRSTSYAGQPWQSRIISGWKEFIYDKNAYKLKFAKNTLTVWNTDKLKLLSNEMKLFRCGMISISEVRQTGKSKTPKSDFIRSEEEYSHMRAVWCFPRTKNKKALIRYNPISSRIISARSMQYYLKFQSYTHFSQLLHLQKKILKHSIRIWRKN